MEPSEFLDEVDILQLMFQPEELAVGTDATNENYFLMTCRASSSSVSASSDIAVDVRVPLVGYPMSRKPLIRVVAAPNVGYHSQLERNITARLDMLDMGLPILTMLIGLIQEEFQLVCEDITLESRRKQEIKESNEAHQRAVEDEMASIESCARKTHMISSQFGIKIEKGEIIIDRKSRFLAHIAPVSSISQVEDVVAELSSNKWLASAAHPAIYAYRFIDQNGRLSQDAEDDGEDGASKKMLFLLEQCNVLGYVLIVTRWFGGILLGPDRFKRILECSRQVLKQSSVIDS